MSEKLPRKKIFMRVRKFLNRPGFHSTAMILAEASRDRRWASSVLEISDCSRKIVLAVDTHDKAHLNNTLRKLDILTKTITRLRAAIVAAVDETKTWKAQHPEKPHPIPDKD